MTRLGMAIDLERCLGCQACLVACKAENEVPLGVFRIRMRETVVGTFPDLRGEFRPEACFHCERPPCVAVCPTGATYRTPDGLVLIDPAKCTGCKACVTACPYGLRYLHPSGHVDKCSFCAHRLADGRPPACVETCPAAARTFGDLDDPASPVSRAIAASRRREVVRSETGARPKVVYLNSRFERREHDAG